ncbi:hypothetical protein ACFE04_029947 [Oxalis oulophora]
MELKSSRWNPTAEQLLALEETYRRGIKTPSSDQIQQMAEHLRKFGEIEGKNVYYWFQNHKARERKKRHRLENQVQESSSSSSSSSSNGFRLMIRRSINEAEETNNNIRVPPPSLYTTGPPQLPISLRRKIAERNNMKNFPCSHPTNYKKPSSPIMNSSEKPTSTLDHERPILELFPVNIRDGRDVSKDLGTNKIVVQPAVVTAFFEFLPLN